MATIHQIDCVSLLVPLNPRAIWYGLLVGEGNGLDVVDTGLGLRDVERPVGRSRQPLIDMVGFIFDEAETAVRQIERLGLRPADVTHIVLTHADPDHTGGLSDFPRAQVHLSAEEHASVARGHFRYLPVHFQHGPEW